MELRVKRPTTALRPCLCWWVAAATGGGAGPGASCRPRRSWPPDVRTWTNVSLLVTRREYEQTEGAISESPIDMPRHATPRLGSSCLASMANTHAAGRPAPPPRVPPLPGSPGREERAALDSSPTPTAGDGGAGRAAATGRGRRKRWGFPAFPAAWRNTSRTRAHTDPESRTEFLAHHVLV